MALSQYVLGPLFLLFFAIVSSNAFEDQDFQGEGLSTLIIEHALNTDINPEFVKRGTISVQSIKSGSARYLHDGNGGKLTEEQQQGIKALVDINGFYKIRIGSKPMGSDTMQYVTAFTKACSLYESGLQDTIVINVDLMGNILGASITTPNAVCTGRKPSGRSLGVDRFITNVEIVQTVPGPVPETQAYVQKLEEEKAQKQKGETQDNRSFFAKYWMYLVPLFIFLMFASGGEQQGGGGR